jgi:hypothetical protein
MDVRFRRGRVRGVPAPTPTDPSGRNAINEMYDRGCDLVEAAMAIRRGVVAFDVAPAVPALLGCIECALDELADASAALSETPFHVANDSREGRDAVIRGAGGDHAFLNLECALQDARDAADAARALAAHARILASGSDPRSPPPR